MRHDPTAAAPRGTTGTPRTLAAEVSGIARKFGRRWALRGVTLDVAPGEVVALLGRNGSGKTTLLRILSTALRPTRGTGRIFGCDLLRDGARVREMVAVLGHTPGLYGDLTAVENLRFALRMSGVRPDPDTIRRALERVGLERDADERVRGFSAGMQRRLALARLILRRPRLALLDEPYASFDVDGIARVNEFVAQQKANGNAVIVSTHDLAKSGDLVDRVFEIADGRAIERALAASHTTRTTGCVGERTGS